MLHVTSDSVAKPRVLSAEESAVSAAEAFAFFGRHAPVLAAVVAAFVAVAGLWILATPPSYVAGAKVLIESQNARPTWQEFGVDVNVDSAEVESQAEVLRSTSVAQETVRRLRLNEDPEFVRRSEIDPMSTVTVVFLDHLNVRRVGQSNAIEVAFTWSSPTKAARIANEVVATYLTGKWRYSISPEGFRRFNDELNRESLVVTNAHVITAAMPPLGKSAPKSSLILAFSCFLGLLTGLCLCLCIDRFDERIRDLDQIGVARGTGRLPPLPIAERGPAADSPPAFAAVDQPFSAFGDALRAVKSKLDASVDAGQKKCIGVMPVTAGAGASTVAVNLAALHARAGLRVLLVDMNFARPSLTRLLAPQAENGLLEFIYESRDCAIRNDRYGFTFVPLVDCANIANPANVFGSQAMSLMLGAAKTEFDLVILDLQSSPEILDGKAAAPILDRIIFAAEYRKTRIGDLLSAIQHAGRLPNEVVLNKCGHPEFGVLIAEALRRAVEAWSSLRWVVDAAMQRVRRWS